MNINMAILPLRLTRPTTIRINMAILSLTRLTIRNNGTRNSNILSSLTPKGLDTISSILQCHLRNNNISQ
jgi:hypothetical protein